MSFRIDVRDVTGKAEASLLHRAAVREFQQLFQCNPAVEPYPTMALLLKAVHDPTVHVLAAWLTGKPMMWLIARESGEVVWLCACTSWPECTPRADPEGAYRRITEEVANRCGTVHGHIENEAIRQLVLRTNEITVQEGAHMRWSGDPVQRPATE